MNIFWNTKILNKINIEKNQGESKASTTGKMHATQLFKRPFQCRNLKC